MTSQLTEDTGLSQKFLGAAQMEQLSSVPVGHFLAMQYAVADHNSDIQRPGVTTLSIDRYYDIYFSQQAVNLTVKYTYTSVAGKKNIYIGTSIVNSEECSIRFNGYITVQRVQSGHSSLTFKKDASPCNVKSLLILKILS